MIWLSRRRINKSPMTLEDPEKSFLKKSLTTPPVKKIDLHFPLGLEVTARNMKGVTIKDAVDAIYKQFRKKVCDPFAFLHTPSIILYISIVSSPSIISSPPHILHLPSSYQHTNNLHHQADDELETPVLAGFEWDKDESWTRLVVHCKKEGAPQPKKKSKKAGKEGEEL